MAENKDQKAISDHTANRRYLAYVGRKLDEIAENLDNVIKQVNGIHARFDVLEPKVAALEISTAKRLDNAELNDDAAAIAHAANLSANRGGRDNFHDHNSPPASPRQQNQE